MIAAIKAWYFAHLQKTISAVLGTFAIGDFVTAMAGYSDEISSLLGPKVYAAIRIAGALLIFWRATHKPTPLPPPTLAASR